jgi:hypothetical protein
MIERFGVPYFYETVISMPTDNESLVDTKMNDLYKFACYYRNHKILRSFKKGRYHVINILKTCVSPTEFKSINNLWKRKHKATGSFIFKGNV